MQQRKIKNIIDKTIHTLRDERGITTIAAIVTVVGFVASLGALIWGLNGMKEEIAAGITNFIIGLLIFAMQALIWTGRIACGYSFSLFVFVVKLVISSPITRSTVFLTAWATIRNWADLVLVVALIFVSIATILNLEQYSAKKLLKGIIIVALLVNFSTVFCGLIIDASNIITLTLTPSLGSESILVKEIDTSYTTIRRKLDNNIDLSKDIPARDAPATIEKTSQELGITTLYAAVFLTVATTFTYLAITFLERYVILAVLFILSPLVFALYVFPLSQAKGLFNQWWQTFLKWCFIGLGGIFFVNVGTDVLASFGNQWGTVATTASSQDLMNGFAQTMFQIFVVLAFFVIGMKITKKNAGPIADMVIKYSGAAAGFAVGGFQGSKIGSKLATGDIGGALSATKEGFQKGFGGVAGFAGEQTGLTRGMQNIKNSATQGLENMGMLRRGYTEAQRRKQLQPSREHEEAAAAQTAAGREQSIVAGPGISKTGRSEFMANFERARDNGELQNMKKEDRDKALAAYSSVTGKTDVYSKSGDSNDVEKDTQAIDELVRTGKAKAGIDKDGVMRTAEYNAVGILRRNSFARKDRKWLQETSQEDKIKYLEQEEQDVTKEKDRLVRDEGKSEEGAQKLANISHRTDRGAQVYDEAVEKKYLHKIKTGKTAEESFDRNARAIVYHDQHFGTTTLKDATTLNYNYAGYDEEGAILEAKKAEIKALHPDFDEVKVEEEARKLPTTLAHKEQAIQSGAEKMSGDKAVDLSPKVQKDWGRRVSASLLRSALNNRRLTQEGRDAMISGALSIPIDEEKLEVIPEKDLAKHLQSIPKYTKEEMDKAEKENQAANPGAAPLSEDQKKAVILQKRKDRTDEIMKKINPKKLGEVVEKLESEPRYTVEEKTKAEAELRATTPIGPLSESQVMAQVLQNHKNQIGEIIDAIDPKELEGIIDKADGLVQEAISKKIVQDVANNIATLKPEQITEKLSAIPEPHFADAINGLTPALRAQLKNKFIKGGATAVTERNVTPEEIAKAESDRAEEIKSLRKKGVMRSSEEQHKYDLDMIRHGKSETEVKKEFEDYYQEVLINSGPQPIEIPTEVKDPAGKITNIRDIDKAKDQKNKQMKDLRDKGFMRSAEEQRQEDIKMARTGKTEKAIEAEFDSYYRGRLQAMRMAAETIKIPTPTTKVPLKPEEQTGPEEYFVDSEIERQWQDLDNKEKKENDPEKKRKYKERKEKLERFVRDLMGRP